PEGRLVAALAAAAARRRECPLLALELAPRRGECAALCGSAVWLGGGDRVDRPGLSVALHARPRCVGRGGDLCGGEASRVARCADLRAGSPAERAYPQAPARRARRVVAAAHAATTRTGQPAIVRPPDTLITWPVMNPAS